MGALQVVHSPELKGLYANSNRLTQPKGTVPRLCNLYLVRRGAFHTVPGSKWISSFDGLAPHTNGQYPIICLKWYSPSISSSPDSIFRRFPLRTSRRTIFSSRCKRICSECR